MFNKKLHLTFISVLFSVTLVFSQSPTDLTGNVSLSTCTGCSDFPPSAFFSSESQIVNAFNFARRAEETQLSLTANSLGTLTLPVNYSTMSAAARALYILNAERSARAGVTYTGSGAVLGLPLEGIETHLSTIAQNHTQDMINNNFFAHNTFGSTESPYDRIDNSGTYGPTGNCREFMSYAENIYVSCDGSSTTPTYTVEQAFFSWIYRDAGSSWGHRRAALIQNTDINGAIGFTNNVGSSLSEGHLGIGIGTRTYNGTAFPSCGGTFNAHLVTMDIADPKPSCIANYTLPIELLSFTGQYIDPYVHLKWITSSEKDNASEIKGSGTTSRQTIYTLDDAIPLRGVNYYRLIQVDYNGKQSLSHVIAVNTDKKSLLTVYPNPTTDVLYVSLSDNSETSLEISNNLGEIVLKTNSSNAVSLDLGNLPSGIYMLRTSKGDIQKIVKY
jgi:uncharacterized protein YkwD